MLDVRYQPGVGDQRRSLTLLCMAAFSLPLMLLAASGLHLENDVAGWLPADDEQSVLLQWQQSLFPDEDRILVSWDGCSVTDPRIDDFAQRLGGRYVTGSREGGSARVAEVTRPADLLLKMRQQDIPLQIALERTSGLLTGDGPLCVALNEMAKPFSQNVADAAVELGRKEFGIEVSQTRSSLPEPSSAYLSKLDAAGWRLFDDLNEYAAAQRPVDLQLIWADMHSESVRNQRFLNRLRELKVSGLGDAPVVEDVWRVAGTAAGVSVLLSEAGALDHKAVLQDIKDAAAGAGIDTESLLLGGRSVVSTELNEAVRDAAWNSGGPLWKIWLRSPIMTSAIVGFVCCWLMLRSWRLCLMVQFTAAVVALAATALLYVSGGSMNMVLAVMPTLLFVITLSGAVHLCNYWRHAVTENGAAAISESLRQAWLPCAFSAATTAFGLASLLSGSLVPVREFGLYSAIGCMFSLFAVLYLLPAMMRLWPEALLFEEASCKSSAWPRIASVIVGNSKLNLAITTVLIVMALWGAGSFRTETRAICSFPKSSDLLQDYQLLEDQLAGIVPVDAIVRFSKTQQEIMPFETRAQAVLQLQNKLKEHPQISGALSLASFLCAGPQSASAANTASADESPVPASRKTGGRLRRNLAEDRIRDAVSGKDAGSSTLSSWIAMPKDAYSQPGNISQLLHHSGDEVWRISCQACLLSADDFEALTTELSKITQSELAELHGEAPECLITGLVPILLKTQQALLNSLIWSFGLAFLLIGGAMVMQLRSLQAALWAMLPNVLPVVIVFGLISWLGIRVDVGTMITASVAMGIAVDGTLHLLAGFQEQLRMGKDRRLAAESALARSGPALLQSSAIIALGLLSLYPVELLLISRFGWIMAALAATALWGDAVLLTGLLAGPLGAVLEKAEQRRQEAVAAFGQTLAAGPEESQIFEIADFPPLDADQHPLSLRGPHLPLWRSTSQLDLSGAEETRAAARSQRK